MQFPIRRRWRIITGDPARLVVRGRYWTRAGAERAIMRMTGGADMDGMARMFNLPVGSITPRAVRDDG